MDTIKDRITWLQGEDKKYSKLYSSGYPHGGPMGLVTVFDIPKEKKCIDLGCGLGELSKHFTDYTGVDVSSWVIGSNKQRKINGTYYHASLDNLTCINKNQYDVGICSDVMEHIPEEKVGVILKSISLLKVGTFYFDIALLPSSNVDEEGKNLHLTLWKQERWVEELKKYFKLKEGKICEGSLRVSCTLKQ